MKPLGWLVCLGFSALTGAMIGVTALAQERTADIELDRSNYSDWCEHIRPSEAELAFYKIPWQRTFQDGIVKADRSNMPLLLWAMNGHPLGCT